MPVKMYTLLFCNHQIERSQKLINLEMITEGLKQLLQENNYTPATIRFYEREWGKIQSFLTEEYGNTDYDMERGLKYLENQYGFITKYNDGTLSQQRVQLLRDCGTDVCTYK